MLRLLSARVIAVVALTVVVSGHRVIAQNQAHTAPIIESKRVHPFSFSLADAYDGGLELGRSRLVSQQSDLGRDDVSERQSVDAFTSLEDGQPGNPGEWELELNFGSISTSDESDPITLKTEIEYTLDGSDFLRNMQLNLAVPVEVGNGDVDGNGDVEFEWQQRWVVEDGVMPTLATLVEVRFPTGFQSNDVDAGLTGTVAKDWGPGTLLFQRSHRIGERRQRRRPSQSTVGVSDRLQMAS